MQWFGGGCGADWKIERISSSLLVYNDGDKDDRVYKFPPLSVFATAASSTLSLSLALCLVWLGVWLCRVLMIAIIIIYFMDYINAHRRNIARINFVCGSHVHWGTICNGQGSRQALVSIDIRKIPNPKSEITTMTKCVYTFFSLCCMEFRNVFTQLAQSIRVVFTHSQYCGDCYADEVQGLIR